MHVPRGIERPNIHAYPGTYCDKLRVGRCGAFGYSEDQPSDGHSGGIRLPGVVPVTRAVRTFEGGHVACPGQRTGQQLAEI